VLVSEAPIIAEASEFAAGLCALFDRCLSTDLLLLPEERPQFDGLYLESPPSPAHEPLVAGTSPLGKADAAARLASTEPRDAVLPPPHQHEDTETPSLVYGVPHLLRLLAMLHIIWHVCQGSPLPPC